MAPPIYVKGGVWTNVEDQILKAAVSKYGLTQWARVASLLPKKTAKQAKARWNEYLNPSIDRSEWTKQEDEKLLNLAKLLPNQWRSIAPVMGRSATQCVERYQKLLDDAVKGSDVSDEDSDKEDLSLSGPGIETLPALGNAFESLPSRPDVEDMDDDEREMLSEAKARLANNLGKKAKRKERERMLDESRRVALLQKRRELKAAGINISLTSKNKAKRKEFDYVADIPHERQPLPGLYDVTNEDHINEAAREEFQKKVKFKGLPEEEEKGPKTKKAKPDAKRSMSAIQSAAGAVSSLEESQRQKRRKLELSAPGGHDDQQQLGQRVSSLAQSLLKKDQKGELAPSTPRPEKLSRKKVVSFLQSLLSKLPKPEVTSTVIVPSIDETDRSESMLDGELDIKQPSPEVDDEWTRTQVMQRGYTVPHPSTLDSKLDEGSEIDKLVSSEAKRLIELDYASGTGPNELLPMDKASYDAVVDEIDTEVAQKDNTKDGSAGKLLYHPLSELQPPPRDMVVVERIYDLLEQLDQSANRADSVTMSDEMISQQEEYDDLCQEIAEKFEQQQDVDIEEWLYAKVSQEEDVALAARSDRLHEMVEDIKAAERRAARDHI